MKTGEKGISVGAIVAIVIVATVVPTAAVVGYVVLSGGIGGGLNSGTATMTAGGDTGRGFDFSMSSVVTPNGHDLGIEPWYNWYGENGATPAVQGYDGISDLIQDIGAVDLTNVTTAPETGYSPDAHAQVGHVYAIKCQENTYAKIRIINITFTSGGYPATIVFDWVYQPDGSRNF